MKTNLVFLLLINIGFGSCRLLEKGVLRKLYEEQILQNDNVPDLAEDKDEKPLETFNDAKLTGEDKKSMEDSSFGNALRKSHEEQTSQDGNVQELDEDKKEKSLETFDDAKLTGEDDKPMEDSSFRRVPQLSRDSCTKLYKGGQCRLYEVASQCERTCCKDKLSRFSCLTVLRSGSCSFHFFKFGACRKTCHGCWIHIHLRSEACNDTGVSPCGRALIQVNGKDYSLHKRGHNIVVIDRYGKFIKRASFDTHGNANSGLQMAKFINSVRFGRIVLIAVQDSGEKYIADATAALATLGATEPYTLGFRSSWVFIGMKENKNFEFKRQAARPRYKGPTEIFVGMNTRPLYVGPRFPLRGK